MLLVRLLSQVFSALPEMLGVLYTHTHTHTHTHTPMGSLICVHTDYSQSQPSLNPDKFREIGTVFSSTQHSAWHTDCVQETFVQ